MTKLLSASDALLCDLCRSIFEGRWEPAWKQRKIAYTGSRQPPDRMFCNDGTLVKISDCPRPDKTHLMSSLHHSVANLKRSKEQCILCAKIWDQLRSTKGLPFDLNHPPKDKVGFYSLEWEPELIIIGYSSRDMAEWHGHSAEVILHTDNLDEDPSFQTAPSRRQSLSRIRQWLSARSTSSHSTYMYSAKQLPTRLLLVGGSLSNPTIRLCETNGFDKTIAYITLSHCWGDKAVIRLLNNSYQSFLLDIPFLELPKTFQDAVKFTLALQVEYLWIDSLCIIQDSNQDWLKEGQLMSLVYAQSFVNLAATSSRDSYGGLFFPRSLLQQRCVLNATWSGQELRQGPVELSDLYDWQRRIQDGPLNQRAWVLQEVTLAPKTIHCAYDQLWWTSNDSPEVFNEMYPDGMPLTLRRSRYQRNLALLSNLEASQIRDCWRKIIGSYTQMCMTFPSDKLIAISGIAEVYQRMYSHVLHNDSYAAGMWKPFLVQDLLWSVSWNTSSLPIRPVLYRAPSWSWASIDSAITFTYIPETKLSDTTLVDVVTSLIDGPFGPVQDGHLILRGRLIPITLGYPYDYGNIGEICINKVIFQQYGFLSDTRQQFSVRMDDPAKHSKLSKRSSAFLAAFGNFDFLILEQTGEAKGEFCRIGILSITGGTGIHMFLDDIYTKSVSQLDPNNLQGYKSCCTLHSVRYWEEARIAQRRLSKPSKRCDEYIGNCDAEAKKALDELDAYLNSVPGCRMLRKLKEDEYLEFDVDSGFYTYRVI